MPKALLTGAAGGIGQATTALLLKKGYEVLVTDASEEALQRAYPTPSPQLRLAKLDVTNYEAWKAIKEAHGDSDILIQLAGIMRAGWFVEQDPRVWVQQLQVNLLGLGYGCRVFGAHFRARGHGHLINIASLAGIAPVPGIAGYTGTKFGVRGLSLALAEELRPYGVAVTVICPGPVRTPLILDELPSPASVFTLSAGGLLEPEDVAQAIWRAIQKKPLEITLPWNKSFAARLLAVWPSLQTTLAGIVRKGAEKRRERLLREAKR